MHRFWLSLLFATLVAGCAQQETQPSKRGGIEVNVPGVKVEIQTKKN